jgi:hypothetical protein
MYVVARPVVLIALALVASCASQKPKPEPPPPPPPAPVTLLGVLDEASRAVCACSDAPCMQQVLKKLDEEGDRFKNYEPTSDEEADLVNAAVQKMTKCLSQHGGSDEQSPAAPWPKVGVRECDEFLQDYLVCIETKVPESVRADTTDSLRQTADAWKRAAATPEGRRALVDACREMRASTKEALRVMNCSF